MVSGRRGPGSEGDAARPADPTGGPASPRAGDPSGARGITAASVHRTLRIVSLALAGALAAFALGAAVLVAADAFHPFLQLNQTVRAGVAVFLGGLLWAAGPISRAARRSEDGAEPLDALQRGVIAGLAVRDVVGVMGAVLILLAGDLWLGGAAALLAGVEMVRAVPSTEVLRAELRRGG